MIPFPHPSLSPPYALENGALICRFDDVNVFGVAKMMCPFHFKRIPIHF